MSSIAENRTSPDDDSPLQALLAGLERARKLTVWTLLALLLGTAAGWVWSSHLFRLLSRPLTEELAARGLDTRLVFTGLTEPFILYFSISLLTGLVVALPALAMQLYVIAAPRVRLRSSALAALFVVTTTALFLMGAAFCYFVLLPFGIRYLLDIGVQFDHAITVRDFLRFAVRLMVAMGFAAQLPLLTFTAARIGLVTARTLWRWFPYATLIAFFMAAWLTPPDGMSQLLLAAPLLVLYLIGIGVAALAGR